MQEDLMTESIREFTERGVVVLRQTLQGDQLEGLTECFDAAGQLSAQLLYLNGLLHGEAVYYSLGAVVRRCVYEAGLLHGEVLDYTLAGLLVQRSNYRLGLLHGAQERYWTNGQLMERQVFEDGRSVGPPEQFDSEGRPLARSSSASSEKAGLLQRLFTGES
jgi:antitoxin component YwqK of YwqJK toxin-antitoxin module